VVVIESSKVYVGIMDQPIAKTPWRKTISWGTIAFVGPLLAILVAAGWLAAHTWISTADSPMPVSAYVAMVLGIIFSVVVGCGLMALLFYSNRHGYDDIGYDVRHRPDDDRG
jgi:hypothetical protein